VNPITRSPRTAAMISRPLRRRLCRWRRGGHADVYGDEGLARVVGCLATALPKRACLPRLLGRPIKDDSLGRRSTLAPEVATNRARRAPAGTSAVLFADNGTLERFDPRPTMPRHFARTARLPRARRAFGLTALVGLPRAAELPRTTALSSERSSAAERTGRRKRSFMGALPRKQRHR
jgi:hypothetical protein